MWRGKFPPILLYAISLVGFSSSTALAQTVPDNTLGSESSTVNQNANIGDTLVDLIEGGATRGNNLFHSFSEFNVGDGSAVYFANPDGIANILTRVTGNNPSEIFGTLGVNGAANLFLLNPNGVVFGENAALDLNGSFLVTTADSYIFQNGLTFGTRNPEAPPLLTVNLPFSWQFRSNSGAITVQNKGYYQTGGFGTPLEYNDATMGLQVNSGKTLGLIGQEVNLVGGIIRTPGANIQLISVDSGTVKLDQNLNTWEFDTSEVERFADIKLNHRALLDTSGIVTGDIQLKGLNILLEDGSAATIQNLGKLASSKITVDAAGSVKLLGSVRNAPDIMTMFGTGSGVAFSRLTTETLSEGTAGDISIVTDYLALHEGGQISSRSYSRANTGNINIDIGEFGEVHSYSLLAPSYFSSTIGTNPFSSGNAGKIEIVAKNMYLSDGGIVSSVSFGSGQGGKVKLNITEDLNISGIHPINLTPSNVGSLTVGQGDSGDLTINTARLTISNRGAVSTSTFADGSAGKLTISASDYIKVISSIDGDARFTSNNSGIASDARIPDPAFRQLLDITNPLKGNSGNIVLNAPRLILSNDAEVSVSNQGMGGSGILQINAEDVFLDTKGRITAFSVSGQGGNIDLNIKDSLLLTNHSSIIAKTTGTGISNQFNVDGGNIAIDANIIGLFKNSEINANALEGKGGNIDILTQGLFVSRDSLITASSEFGLDGNINVENISGDRPLELDQLPSNLVDRTQQIAKTCGGRTNQFAIAGRGGLPENPWQNLRGQAVWQDLRLTAIDSSISNHELEADTPEKPILEAQAWRINDLGRIELIVTNAVAHRLDNQAGCQ